MKILHVHKLTDIAVDEFENIAALAAARSSADILLLEYEAHSDPMPELEATDVIDVETIGYVPEPIMGKTLLVPEKVMTREELLSICGLITEAFPTGGRILQLGAFDGVFASVASEMGTTYVVDDFEDVNADVFSQNIEEPNPRVKVIEMQPANALVATTEPFQPDAILIVDNQEPEVWAELVRHMKPGIPTPVVTQLNSGFAQFLDEANIYFEQTEPSKSWVALTVTPVYAESEPESEPESDSEGS